MKNKSQKSKSQSSSSQKTQILEGSRAIALTIKNISPHVVSAYPITPQTHIVEDLAKFKADGEVDYEYVRAESEFAAASIVEGASATGARTYTATSSQGLLLMVEVLFNIAGMRLPVVLTCANRGVSAPITIWNDHQDAMTVRDAGWIMLFAENHQEAVDQHIMAYKLAEKLNLPVMVNIDGFVLTHSYEPVSIPTKPQIKKYLPSYKPKLGQYLNPAKPATLGAFASPEYYMEIRQELHNDLTKAEEVIKEEYKKYHKIINKKELRNIGQNNGLVEYYGPKNAKTILIAMGSVVGTIKDIVDKQKNVAVLKIKTYRPFPEKVVADIIKNAKNVAVLDKSVSLGYMGVLASEIKAIADNPIKVKSFIVGLGGRDITKGMVLDIIGKARKGDRRVEFVG